MSSFTRQILTRHHCVPCRLLGLCNGPLPLLSRSSQVTGELSTQTIPIGLAKYFARNMLRVQYKLGRRAITLEGELRTSFSEELLSGFKRWVKCSGGQAEAVRSVSAFSSARLGPTAGGVPGAARLCTALNTEEHNKIHVYVKIRSLDFILKAVRSRCTLYKLSRT